MKNLISTIFSKLDYRHLLVLVGFALLSLVLFYPVLQGKELLQSDSVQYAGMARQLQEERQANGEELYWIDNAFGGMPTYQLGAKYSFDVLTSVHKVIRLLPAPTFLMFLYFLGAYVFFISFRFPIPYAVIGALAYGLSTYLFIIIQVGHNTKAQALGYMPFVFAAVHYLFKNKSLWGIVFVAFSMAMQIRANHYQMTYYMLLLLGLYVAFQLWEYYRSSSFSQGGKKIIHLVASGLLALSLNATSLLATSEYTQFSTRGKSELTIDEQGNPISPRDGLSYDYITQFSYGIFESFNLIVPRIMGGGSGEDVGRNSDLYKALIQGGVSRSQASNFVQNAPTYWGDQPILEAPAYIGIVLFFLAALTLYLPKNSTIYWLYAGTLFSLLLSWGKNFPFLTQVFIDYFPLYSKFRAVSSIQVVLEFCLPVLGIFGLKALLQSSAKIAQDALKKAVIFVLGLLGVLYFAQYVLSFSGGNDAYYTSVFGEQLMALIREERIVLYSVDVIRAMVFVSLAGGFLLLFTLKRLSASKTLLGVGVLLVIDLLQINARYHNDVLFVFPRQKMQSFAASPADLSIKNDTTHYRVYEPALGLQGARTAYHHNAIGGYHGAKPRRFEAFINLMQAKQASQLLNLLNVKYVLLQNENGETQAVQNPENYGPAWFVNRLLPQPNPNDLYAALNATDFETTALVETDHLEIPDQYTPDEEATIRLLENHPEHKKYLINSAEESFVVFSEMYYKNGWEATIDGNPTEIYPVNFLLRGLYLPKGKHEVTFTFSPAIVQQGGYVQLGAILILLFLVSVASWTFYKENQ